MMEELTNRVQAVVERVQGKADASDSDDSDDMDEYLHHLITVKQVGRGGKLSG